MFSLIITIISIALVAALAVATVYYGGNQFNQGNSKAAGSAVVTSAQQISAANTLIYNDTGAYATAGTVTVAATCGTTAGCFPTTYLKSIPKPPAAAIKTDGSNAGFSVAAGNVVQLTVDGNGATDVCNAINTSAGLLDTNGVVTIPADQATFTNKGVQYGCYGAAGGPYTFQYQG